MSSETLQDTTSAAQIQLAPVQLESLYLETMNFSRLGTPSGEAPESEIQFQLGVKWPSPRRIAVRVQMTVRAPDVLSSTIAYVVTLAKTEPEDQAFWRQVAARLAPIILLPYIREVFSSAALRAGFSEAFLPIINIGSAFDPDKINMQKEPDDIELPV